MKLDGKKFKIVHICGSPHATIGNTYNLVKQFMEELKNKGTIVELINHFIVKEHVEECRGCIRCMRKDDCVMASKDGVSNMINNLLDADFVIFSSPIYVLNVTSLMKKFFDRTAFMTHRLVLENKIGIYILSSQGLGIENVSNYMQSVMEAMGVNVLGSINGIAFFYNQFLNQEEIDDDINSIINILETENYVNQVNYSNNEKDRRKKFAFLMEQEEISQKLFNEDAKYWASRRTK